MRASRGAARRAPAVCAASHAVDSAVCAAAASEANAPRLCLYFALYHEAVCANLLERLALHGGLCDAAGEDALSELADYALRSVRALAAHRLAAAAA